MENPLIRHKLLSMSNKLFPFMLILSFFLSGCSWIERFVIFNTSEETIFVSYSIGEYKDGFPIFDQYVDAYQLKSNGTIDWYKEHKIEDMDSVSLSFHFELPPHTALIFGNLHNDTYERHDQTFINRRHFNLEKLEISSSKEKITTTPEGFDQLFKKKKGIIGYTVK